MKILWLVIATMLFPSVAAIAQETPTPVRAFRSFTRESASGALPQATVIALHEDSEGTIWIATLGGIAKVERGYVERLTGTANAPTAGALSAFATRRLGGLHVAGTGGLWTYNGIAWEHSDTPEPLISLAEVQGDHLIGITTTGRLISRQAASGPWTDVADVPPFAYETVAKGLDGTVLVGGQLGVSVFDGTAIGRLVCGATPASRARRVHVDALGTVWVGGDDGKVYYCTAQSTQWRALSIHGWQGGRIRSISGDRRGRIWVGGDNGNVAFGSDTTPFTRWTPANGVKGATVTSLLADRTGSVWLGFNGAGLQQWIGEAWSHRTFWQAPGDTDSMFVFNISPTSDGGFVAAVFSRGVLKWDGRTMRAFGRADGITEDIRCVVEVEPGVMWAGGRQALFESTNGRTFSQTYALPLGFINGFFRAPDGTWWAATSSQGLLRRSGTTWVPANEVNPHLPDQSVRQVVWRENGEFWVATDRGVVRFADASMTPTLVPMPEGLTSVGTLLEVSPDQMWMGGVGGLAVGSPDSWRVRTAADGLPGATVYAMARATDGSVWIGGSAGVARYHDDRWTRFDVTDGLISEESNALGLLPLDDGDVLVGTMSGIAHFHADVQTLPLPDLPLYWRGQAASTGGSLTLAGGSRRLDLDWMAPWPRPDAVEYRTRITPLDAQWSEPTTTPQLRIENMAVGTWTVEVTARLTSVVGAAWIPAIRATVRVEPRWWETWWASVGAILLLGGAVAGLVSWRTRRLGRKADDLERAVQEAMVSVKVLRGLLPICAHCKKIRDDRGYWRRLEDYIGQNSEADFSHSLCPDCERTHYPEMHH